MESSQGGYIVEHTDVSRMRDIELRRFCLIVTGLEVTISVLPDEIRYYL